MFLEYYLYYFYYTFLGFPFIIRVAVTFISLFVPLTVLVFYFLTIIRQRFYRKKRLQQELRKKYLDKIRSIITAKDDFTFSEINSILDCNQKKLSNKRKRILTNSILYIYGKQKDINDANYQKVINYFGLRQFWEKKLKNGSLASRQRALRKLDDFDIEIPGSVITSLTYNRNSHLRKRARSSYLYFSKNSPFKFLEENFDKTFNDWDKIEIHRMLLRRAERGLPSLTQWIKNSDNPDFKCFLIDEIKYFKQKESSPFLAGILNESDLKLRKHCIEALGELKYYEIEESLIRDYMIQPQIIQQCIIQALHKMNTGKALSFFKEAYYNAHNTENEIAILKAIYNYGKPGKELFHILKKDVSGFSRLVFDHVSNPLIRYN